MRFAQPDFLWGVVALPFLALLFVAAWKRRSLKAERFASRPMLAHIARQANPWVRAIRLTLLLIAVLFLLIALSRPQWGRKLELVQRKGLDIMLVQDVSLSMLAQDIQPSRLIRSRHEISGFLENLQGDRIGLVAFSGEAQILCPLTLDYGAVRVFLEDLQPGWLLPGTDLGVAMEKAMQAFRGAGSSAKYQVMVLVTDGESHDPKVLDVAKKAAQQGITLYTVGIGSRDGVPIPIGNNGSSVKYKKDRHGNVVTTRLEEATLQQIASIGHGKYYYAGPGEFQLQKVLEDVADRERQEMEGTQLEQYQERYQWPLALALFFLILEALVPEVVRRRQMNQGRFAHEA